MATNLTTGKGRVTLRMATIGDAASLLVLRLEALSKHPEAFAADLDKTAADGDHAWAERIGEYASTQTGAILVAHTADKLIGMSGIARGHWPKTQHNGTLWGVYVCPEWRGYKIGKAIVNGCVGWAADHALTGITLGVNSRNKAAIRCYAACGFIEYGVEPKAILYNGIYYDELLTVKLI